ncbi:cytochrome c [uncultured Algibacter sp.]|uniref:c-type cytochrome n=1 Tax=uncultured Algibacter sp. TaxID=298659 RepID=UPI002629AA59|nr:cytochrome c [uncultured Algibacter sp.]
MNKGKRIYASNCITCHMANGEGVSGAFPPLAKSDYLSNIEKTIEVILNGASGEMKVNGKSYYGTMVSFSMLTNQQIADVMNYIQNSWGNESEVVDAKLVEKVRN